MPALRATSVTDRPSLSSATESVLNGGVKVLRMHRLRAMRDTSLSSHHWLFGVHFSGEVHGAPAQGSELGCRPQWRSSAVHWATSGPVKGRSGVRTGRSAAGEPARVGIARSIPECHHGGIADSEMPPSIYPMPTRNWAVAVVTL